jgi:ATP-dependent RNA helicase DHX36
MIHHMRMQFLDLLEGIGFVEKGSTIMDYNEYGGDMEVVRAVLCAGLFPSVVVCRPKGKKVTLHTREDGRVSSASHLSSLGIF